MDEIKSGLVPFPDPAGNQKPVPVISRPCLINKELVCGFELSYSRCSQIQTGLIVPQLMLKRTATDACLHSH